MCKGCGGGRTGGIPGAPLPNPFIGELGFCLMSYAGQEESIIVPGPGTRTRYETGTSRPIILVDLRDRNRLVQRGDFAIG